MAHDSRLLLLAEPDNVLVACTDLPAGTEVLIDGEPVRLTATVLTGHKLARRTIGQGEKVVKYAAPIGSARTAISIGDYVHTHNLGSDYIPTFDRTGREAS